MSDIIMNTLKDSHHIFYKNKYDENKVSSMRGSQLLIIYVININITPDKRYNP